MPGDHGWPRPAWRDRRLLAAGLVAVAAIAAVVLVDRDDSPKTATAAPISVASAVPQFSSPKATSAQKDLLDQAVGFGSGVTGGAGGRVVTVSTAKDSGPGSLRAAVAGDAPKWVVFDRDLTITLASQVDVGSNTTIDGRGHHVTVLGRPDVSGFKLFEERNVVIESLTMRSFGAVEDKKDTSNAIVAVRTVGLWIDHNDLSRTAGKLLAIAGSRGVTVSWNHLHDQRRVMQIGNMDNIKESKRSTVTVVHNFFDHDGLLIPEVAFARVHVVGNYYLDWGALAVRSTRSAQVLLEGNVFQIGQSTALVRTRPVNRCNDARDHCESYQGALRAEDNTVLPSSVTIPEASPGTVFDATTYYKLPVLAGDLATVLQARVGPQR